MNNTNIVGRTGRISVTPAIDTNAYTAGDNVGGKLTLLDSVLRHSVSGIIQGITIVDQAKQSAALDVLFFRSDPSNTTFTNNAALDVADADLLTCIGHVSIAASDYCALADNSVATKMGLGLAYAAPQATIYAALIARGTPTYATATDLQLIVHTLQD